MLIFIPYSGVNAQERNLKQEILVYILPDSLEILPQQSGRITLSSVEINSKQLSKTFQKLSLNEISKTFPGWETEALVHELKNGITVKRPSFDRIFTLYLPPNVNVETILEEVKKEPSVLFAEQHMDAQLFNDPSYPAQWHLNNTGQSSGGSVDADIDAPEAWQIFTGSSSIKIGVFDTGVDLSHDDFLGKVSGDNIPTFGADADRYHGTHVAGIAAAKANNGESGRGVDWNAQIVSKKIFGDYGSYLGDNTVVNKILDAMDNQNVDIMNHSWGGTQYKTIIRQAFA